MPEEKHWWENLGNFFRHPIRSTRTFFRSIEAFFSRLGRLKQDKEVKAILNAVNLIPAINPKIDETNLKNILQHSPTNALAIANIIAMYCPPWNPNALCSSLNIPNVATPMDFVALEQASRQIKEVMPNWFPYLSVLGQEDPKACSELVVNLYSNGILHPLHLNEIKGSILKKEQLFKIFNIVETDGFKEFAKPYIKQNDPESIRGLKRDVIHGFLRTHPAVILNIVNIFQRLIEAKVPSQLSSAYLKYCCQTWPFIEQDPFYMKNTEMPDQLGNQLIDLLQDEKNAAAIEYAAQRGLPLIEFAKILIHLKARNLLNEITLEGVKQVAQSMGTFSLLDALIEDDKDIEVVLAQIEKAGTSNISPGPPIISSPLKTPEKGSKTEETPEPKTPLEPPKNR